MNVLKVLYNSKLGNKQQVQIYQNELQTKYSAEIQQPELQQILQVAQQHLELILLQKSQVEHPYIEECLELIEKDPKNLEVRYRLAEYYFNHQLTEEAIETCLEVKSDRSAPP